VEAQLHLKVAILGQLLLLAAIQEQLRLKGGIREALPHKVVILERHHQVVIRHLEDMVNSRR
jgi:hypothetical protein